MISAFILKAYNFGFCLKVWVVDQFKIQIRLLFVHGFSIIN